MVDHLPDGGTPWLGWVDTAALLSQAQAYELAGSLRHAEAAYGALIVAATRQRDHATLAAAFRHRAVLAHQAGDTVRARSGTGTLFTAQFTTKVKPPFLPFGWRGALLGGLFLLLAFLVWRWWKARRRTHW